MKLLKHIKKIAPINNESDIQTLLKIMKDRNVYIGTYQENLLLYYTVPELHAYLKECILSYRKAFRNKKLMPSVYRSNRKEKDSSNGISSNGLSDHEKRALNMFSLRNDSGEKTLSERGYEYGLSDW